MSRICCVSCALLLFVAVLTGCATREPLGTAASDGTVEVHYVTGRIGKVTFVSNNSQTVSDKDLLQIKISIENKSDSSKLQYKGWGGDSLTTGHKAVLKDDLGNIYKPVTFGLLHRPAGQKANESLYPGTILDDVLVFEVPVAKANMMHLMLPRRNYTTDLNGPTDLELAIPAATFGNWQ